MGMSTSYEVSRSNYQLSPERSESSPSPEVIIKNAPLIAGLLNRFWPQTTRQNGETIAHYVITGSLGVALLAGSTEFHDEGKLLSISPSARRELSGAVHLIHDIDHVRQDPPWPDSSDSQMPQFIKAVKLLPGIKLDDHRFDSLYKYTDERFITVPTSTGDYLLSPPDSAAAYKLLSALSANNFLNKPYQLNRETPSLIKAATDIYSEERVWERVREVFQAYDRVAINKLSQYERIDYMLKRATKDPCLSPDLKSMLNKAADISGTKTS